MKVLSGSERKCNDWAEYFHQLLFTEFERFSSSNIKLSRGVLQFLSVLSLNDNDSIQTPQDADPSSGRPICEHVTLKWIDSFLSRFNIVLLKQSGFSSRFPHSIPWLRRELRTNLSFRNGHSWLICIMKMWLKIWLKLILIFDMDDSKTLGLLGRANLDYPDIIGGADGSKLVIGIRGSCNAKLRNPFIVLRIETVITL